MVKRGAAPIVRHSYAPDPDPDKVKAALEVWRLALARRMVLHRIRPAEPDGAAAGDASG